MATIVVAAVEANYFFLQEKLQLNLRAISAFKAVSLSAVYIVVLEH